MVLTVHLTAYHNEDSLFFPYVDGHRLTAVASHVLTFPTVEPRERLVSEAAHWAWRTFNADLPMLEEDRFDLGGETTFLAAAVYRLMGRRSLSVGDVLRLRLPDAEIWLAYERLGHRSIGEPTNRTGDGLTAAAVYQHLASPRRARRQGST